MEEIRAFACDELIHLSHGGDEVGGVLFGTRHEDLIRILTWRPIACEHTQGKDLRLSYNDRMNLAVQLEMARQNSDLKDFRPLGWFVSRLGGDVSLSASDLDIYSGFFPEAWQVTLVICPHGGGCAQAGFFVREADDKVQSEASYQCFELQPLHVTSSATDQIATDQIAANVAPEPEALPLEPADTWQPPLMEQPAPTAQPVRAAPQPTPPPAAPMNHIETRWLAPPAEEIPEASFPSPSFQIEEPLPTHERWFWAIPIVLALAIAAFMLYQRRAPSPGASIALRALSEAQTVRLVWDVNSRSILDSYRGEIDINDGGKHSQVSLTSDQLHAGKISYLPQSSDIAFMITVYSASGEPIHDATRLIAPVFNAPTQSPQPPSPPNSPPPVPPAPAVAEYESLQRQVQQLKDELGQERARADELQNLVRILENRLGIPATPPKPQRRR